MGAIRQELILVDQFSKTIEDFIKKTDKINDQQKELSKKTNDSTDSFDKMVKGLDKFNRSAEQAVFGGVGKLLKTVLALGGAYVGISKLSETIKSGFAETDDNVRLANRFQAPGSERDIANWKYSMAAKYGMTLQESGNMMSALGDVSLSGKRLEQLVNIAAKIAATRPGSSVQGVANDLAGALVSRDAYGFASQYGLSQRGVKTNRINWDLENGNFGEALSEIEMLATKAGATEQALNRMLDSPGFKIQKLGALIQNSLTRGANEFVIAMEPAINKLLEFVQNGKLIDMMVGFFNKLSQAVMFIANNFETISRVIIYATGLLIAFKIALGLITVAQWAFNIAAMSNPYLWIAITVVAALTAIAAGIMYITFKQNEASNSMGVWYNAVLTLAQVFIFLYNTVVTVINSIIANINNVVKAFQTVGNFIYNFFYDPILAVYNLTRDLFNMIMGGVIGTATLFNTILGGSLDGLMEKLEGFKGMVNDSYDSGENAWNNIKNKIGLPSSPKSPYDTSEDAIPYIKGINYNKADDFADALLKYKKLFENDNELNTLREISLNTLRGADLLTSINYKWDPDAWMDAFKEYTHDDMERQSVLNVNNNIPSPNVNVTIYNNNADEKLIGDQIEKTVTGMVQQGMATAGNMSYTI